MKNEEIKINELVEISEERSNEIIKAWQHALIDSEQWSNTFAMAKKMAKPLSVAEGIYFGWTFSQIVKTEEQKQKAAFMAHLLTKLEKKHE